MPGIGSPKYASLLPVAAALISRCAARADQTASKLLTTKAAIAPPGRALNRPGPPPALVVCRAPCNVASRRAALPASRRSDPAPHAARAAPGPRRQASPAPGRRPTQEPAAPATAPGCQTASVPCALPRPRPSVTARRCPAPARAGTEWVPSALSGRPSRPAHGRTAAPSLSLPGRRASCAARPGPRLGLPSTTAAPAALAPWPLSLAFRRSSASSPRRSMRSWIACSP